MVRDAADSRFSNQNPSAPCGDTPEENFEIFCALMRFLAPTFAGFQPSRDVQTVEVFRL
jgi:hypothetical protein